MDLNGEHAMNNEEKFVFDLQGYLIIKNVLNTDEVAELNKITDERVNKSINYRAMIENRAFVCSRRNSNSDVDVCCTWCIGSPT